MHSIWLALVTTIISQPLGALWYSPYMFASAWADALRVSKADVDPSNPRPFIVTAVCIFIQSYFADVVLSLTGTQHTTATIFLLLQIWFAFTFCPTAYHYGFSLQKYVTATLIDSGHSLMTLFIFITVKLISEHVYVQ